LEGADVAIITCAQVKGGSGKTTLAMCLVAELAARGGSVAALDLDPNRPLGRFFPRIPELAGVRVAVPDGETRVSALVRRLAADHDHVVIDLMGAATNDTQVAMAVSDLVVIPSQLSATDLACGIETWHQAAEAEDVAGRQIARAILLVRTSAGATRPRIEAFIRQQYEAKGARVMTASFGDRTAWKEMTVNGHVPHLHERDSMAAQNFAGVFDEIVDLIGFRAPARRTRRAARA
jgi:chromosome partitioning protein